MNENKTGAQFAARQHLQTVELQAVIIAGQQREIERLTRQPVSALTDEQIATIEHAARKLGVLGYTGPCSDVLEILALLAASPKSDDKRDAERYRWLRDQDWFSGPLCVLRDPKRVLTSGIGLGADCPSRSRLDTAIDAAIAATPPQPKPEAKP